MTTHLYTPDDARGIVDQASEAIREAHGGRPNVTDSDAWFAS